MGIFNLHDFDKKSQDFCFLNWKCTLLEFKWRITLVGNSNDPPRKSSESLYCIISYTVYCCILGNNKRPIDLSRIVKTGRKWSKLVKTGRKWSKLVKTGNDLPRSWDFYLNISEPNFSSIWSFTLRTIIHILWKFDNSEHFYFPL